VRKLPSKRFQARYTGPDGEEHRAPITFETKGDAQTWLDMQSAAITEHRWRPAPPPAPSAEIFKDYSTRWLEDRELKPRTRAEYKRMLDNKLVPEFGAKPVSGITAELVRDWHGRLDAKHKTARSHAYALLRTILASAVEDDLLSVNPAQIKGASTARRSKTIRPATPSELAKIAEALPPRYRCMVLLSSWAALRFGEVTELRRRDVDLEKRVIKVARAVTWPDGQPNIGTPKSEAGDRDVAIPPHIVPAIKHHLENYAQPGLDGLLFPNTKGEHMHHGSLYKVFKPARAAAGRPDLTWHGLRHTGATYAAQAGATLAELMARLGHSTVNAAMRYQHAAAHRDRVIADAMSTMAETSSPEVKE
jgi:integrase